MNQNTENGGEELPVPAAKAEAATAKPPHPLDGQWYMNVGDRIFGPYSGHELKEFAEEGRLERDTQVNRMGTHGWTDADTDSVLKRFFAQPDKPPLPASATGNSGSAHAGDNGTVVQVTNNIQAPGPILDPGADKSPGLALLLSLVVVGLGQIYNGEIGKGIMMFIGCILLWSILLGWIVNIWSMIDAYRKARDLRTRRELWLANARAP